MATTSINAVESLIDAWLSLPVWASIFSLAALLSACALLCYVVLASRVGRRYAASGARVSPAMVMSVSVLFALLAGFLGSDIAQRVTRAHHATADEARALTIIEALTRDGTGRLVNLRKLGEDYARIVINEELLLEGESVKSPALTRVLEDLKREAAIMLLDNAPSSATAIDAALLLSEARVERLIVGQETAGFQWFTVIALALLMIIALGLVHLDNLAGIATTWIVFIAATVIVLGMLAIRDNPFSPPIRISAAPLQEAFDAFQRDRGSGQRGIGEPR